MLIAISVGLATAVTPEAFPDTPPDPSREIPLDTSRSSRRQRPSPGIPAAIPQDVRRLRYEARVIHQSTLEAIAGLADDSTLRGAAAQALAHWLTRYHFVVLETRPGGDRAAPTTPGLVVHVHAPAIEAMSRTDLLWEGRPRPAHSLGRLIDYVIFSARDQGRPLQRLIITGHAGLPGCCALGSRLEDCVFNGRLSPHQAQQFRRLRPYLADHAVIELRQCGSAAGKAGDRLLASIHEAAGCSVVGYPHDFRFGFSRYALYKQISRAGEIETFTPDPSPPRLP